MTFTPTWNLNGIILLIIPILNESFAHKYTAYLKNDKQKKSGVFYMIIVLPIDLEIIFQTTGKYSRDRIGHTLFIVHCIWWCLIEETITVRL